MASTFRHKITPGGLDIPDDTPCVYKVHFGSKYWIWKGKSLDQSVKTVMTDLDRKLRLGYELEDIYFEILQHIKRTRVIICTVEPLFFSKDPSEIMDFEAKELEIGKADMDCLNVNEQLTPKWISEPTQNKAPGDTISPVDRGKSARRVVRSIEPQKTKPESQIDSGVNSQIAHESDFGDLDELKNMLSQVKKN